MADSPVRLSIGGSIPRPIGIIPRCTTGRCELVTTEAPDVRVAPACLCVARRQVLRQTGLASCRRTNALLVEVNYRKDDVPYAPIVGIVRAGKSSKGRREVTSPAFTVRTLGGR